MSHFADAFWSGDYAGGLGVLFGKLQQGVKENEQLLTIARMRADAEELYGQHMGDIGPATDRITDGFSRDDGASVRKAYDGVRTEMVEAAAKHRKIAANIRELVVYPFGRWCEQHSTRVQGSQDELQSRIKAHDRQAQAVAKLRSQYFNKCRLVEDIEEEDKLAFKEPQTEPQTSPKAQTPAVKIQQPDEFDEPPAFEIGDNVFQLDQMKKILAHILDNVKLGEAKVPILGTYANVSTGADIVDYIQKHMNGTTISYAERVGQDLITCGFLRLVGNVGNTFANSSRMNYQWRPKSFQLAGYPETRKGLARSTTTMSVDSVDSALVTNVQDYIAGWNPLNNAYPNETPAGKLKREAQEADDRYKSSIRKLDLLRCTLEEAMIEHLRFMERCELDRLKAIKSVILDFSGTISNVIPSLQSTVDKMMLFQETVQPLGDLRYLLENYRTGPFIPKVQPYENYYNSVDEQTFGIDIEARARADRKRVPLIITSLLMFLDQHYPLLDGDEARRAIWIIDVPLAATHRLRNEINNGRPVLSEVLEKYEIPIIASLLKLYLLELPDSIVSSSIYEVIKSVYSSPQTADLNSPNATATRISVLQNTLGQLRLANIASLDAILTHFVRLLDLTSADETYEQNLTNTLAPCILRPKTESSLQFDEKCHVRFLRDLFAHKEPIFNELKRSSSLQHSASVARAASTAVHPQDNRSRALSTDESNRRAHMEERQRAIASRSRASSPAPRDRETVGPSNVGNQRHRRDSSRGPETRFPVHPVNVSTAASPGVAGLSSPRSVVNPASRRSLEVPGEGSGTPQQSGLSNSVTTATIDQPRVNGHGTPSVPRSAATTDSGTPKSTNRASVEKPLPNEPDIDPTVDLSSAAGGIDVEKSNSLNRARFGVRPGNRNSGPSGGNRSSLHQRDSIGSSGGRRSLENSGESRGVELVDRAMDD